MIVRSSIIVKLFYLLSCCLIMSRICLISTIWFDWIVSVTIDGFFFYFGADLIITKKIIRTSFAESAACLWYCKPCQEIVSVMGESGSPCELSSCGWWGGRAVRVVWDYPCEDGGQVILVEFVVTVPPFWFCLCFHGVMQWVVFRFLSWFCVSWSQFTTECRCRTQFI